MITSLNRWLVCPQPRPGASCRLFCFPHAGGGSAVFSRWGDHLPVEVEVCAVQMPGRETRLREAPLTRVSDVAEALAEQLRSFLDVPFAFFGHSLGAHVSFEIARLLRSQGSPGPRHFFASAARAPQVPDPFPPLSHLPDDEFIDKLGERFGGVPAEIRAYPELLQLMMVPLRADIEMCETYRYQHQWPLDCAITVLGGTEDCYDNEHLIAWREQTRGGFKLVMFSGGHFFIQTHTERILQMVSAELRLSI